MQPDLAEVLQAITVAAGRAPGTLLLRNANLINIFSGETYLTDLLIAGRLIAAVGIGYTAATEIDLAGRYVCPGLIDGHVHLESALVEPREYAKAVVPRGVSSVICDPHEIANVLGMVGLEFMLAATEHLPMDVYFTASSSVPATTLETAGAHLDLADIDQLLSHPRVVGVAELMNFPGIIAGAPEEVSKSLLAGHHRKVADGHAPQVGGKALNAYLAAGISSDHEASTLLEAEEKLRLGAMVMIREGSAARNLTALLPLIRPETAHQLCFVTDDRHPHDLMADGGVDLLVRRAIAAGIPPATAIRLASLNVARYFQLSRQGAIAPGYQADILVLDDLASFRVAQVYKAGRLVAQDGHLLEELPRYIDTRVMETVRLPDLTAASLAIPADGSMVRAIGLVPGEILTIEVHVKPLVADGFIIADPAQDLAKLAVIERHGRHGSIGLGLVQGFGMQRGAIASSVGHDSHNLLLAGMNDADMLVAARSVAVLGGGFVCVANGEVLASLPLPVAGLMSMESLATVRTQLDQLEVAARTLGVTMQSPFMMLSFLALPVIGAIKLTDLGLVQVDETGVRFTDLHPGLLT
jgi:adenine deaminase